MLPDPLHPAVVHFPIVLAILLPAVALAALFVGGRRPRAAWLAAVVLSALVAGSAWLAAETGEGEEDRVERVVGEAALETHEERAERFLYLSLATLGLVALGLAPGRAGAVGRWTGTAATLGLVVAVWLVGASGGELVYRHGAASAYVDAPTSRAAAPGGDRARVSGVGEDDRRAGSRERDGD